MSKDAVGQQPAVDPAAMWQAFATAAQKSAAVMAKFMERQTMAGATTDELGIAKAFMELHARMLNDPAQLAQSQFGLLHDYMQLWQNAWMGALGQPVAPLAQPAPGDSRFKAEDWSQNFLFDFIKQSYLVTARHVQGLVANAQGLPEQTQRKVDFFTRQYIDAMSPRNFLATNPEVLRETLRTNGQNLVRGLTNLLTDLERGGGDLRISQTDAGAFKLGENIGTSPGKVVYQTDLMQLIQFTPSTEQVFKRPLLIIPPWINKYYILDLREKNSFVRWAVSQGHTVFVVSWVNPDGKLAAKGFDDYLVDGALAAVDAVLQATGEKDLNAIGYCLGGTLLGCTLAYMAARNDKRIACATFFVTMLDFEEPGDLGVFIDEEQVSALEKRMKKRGYLEGSEMATTFNMLRANDLIWSFVVNNYLLGKEPFAFDLLYWNSDSTRMPAKMHSYYLRNMYMNNRLREPGAITLAGEAIDLSKVTAPLYFLSTMEDHIAPWKSTYAGARLFSGPVRFVLGQSGHIAGVINPPAANKYGYWTNPKLVADAEHWLQAAEQHAGSWWGDWEKWVGKLNQDKMGPARVPGKGKLKAIEDAPGSYVKARSG